MGLNPIWRLFISLLVSVCGMCKNNAMQCEYRRQKADMSLQPSNTVTAPMAEGALSISYIEV